MSARLLRVTLRLKIFTNALHEGYDGLNPLESTFARALDGAGVPWFRNPPRSGYGIPLVDIGDTETFYPDFIFWTGNAVVCVDTKDPIFCTEKLAGSC
jgi:type III restriction enzyme